MKPTIADAFRIIQKTYGPDTAADLHYRFLTAQENLHRAENTLHSLESSKTATVPQLDDAKDVYAEAKLIFDKIVDTIKDASQL